MTSSPSSNRFSPQLCEAVLRAPKVVEKVPSGSVVARRVSEPLRVILRDMLKFSNNLTAEMAGLTATSARSGRVNSLKASASNMSKWAEARFGVSGLKLVDHSGLGSDSRMTASAMAQMVLPETP